MRTKIKVTLIRVPDVGDQLAYRVVRIDGAVTIMIDNPVSMVRVSEVLTEHGVKKLLNSGFLVTVKEK